MHKLFRVAALAGAAALICGGAQAAPVNGTGNVTPDAIFGSGNANGSYTGETRNNIEVGLRGKQRFPAANVFNYDGDRTYTFDSTVLTTNPANRSVFNFEWSINVDQSGTSGAVLSDFGYALSFDTDASAGVNFTTIDPMLGGFVGPTGLAGYFDHSLGDNSTPNGGGVESSDPADLLANLGLFSVAQQSSNLGFGFSADPDRPGIYDFKLEVLDLTTLSVLSSADISVVVEPVPVPAALPLMLAGVGVFGFVARRKAKAKAAA